MTAFNAYHALLQKAGTPPLTGWILANEEPITLAVQRAISRGQVIRYGKPSTYGGRITQELSLAGDPATIAQISKNMPSVWTAHGCGVLKAVSGKHRLMLDGRPFEGTKVEAATRAERYLQERAGRPLTPMPTGEVPIVWDDPKDRESPWIGYLFTYEAKSKKPTLNVYLVYDKTSAKALYEKLQQDSSLVVGSVIRPTKEAVEDTLHTTVAAIRGVKFSRIVVHRVPADVPAVAVEPARPEPEPRAVGYVYAVIGSSDRSKKEKGTLLVWPIANTSTAMDATKDQVRGLTDRRGYGAIQLHPDRSLAEEVEVTRQTWNRDREPKIDKKHVVVYMVLE